MGSLRSRDSSHTRPPVAPPSATAPASAPASTTTPPPRSPPRPLPRATDTLPLFRRRAEAERPQGGPDVVTVRASGPAKQAVGGLTQRVPLAPATDIEGTRSPPSGIGSARKKGQAHRERDGDTTDFQGPRHPPPSYAETGSATRPQPHSGPPTSLGPTEVVGALRQAGRVATAFPTRRTRRVSPSLGGYPLSRSRGLAPAHRVTDGTTGTPLISKDRRGQLARQGRVATPWSTEPWSPAGLGGVRAVVYGDVAPLTPHPREPLAPMRPTSDRRALQAGPSSAVLARRRSSGTSLSAARPSRPVSRAATSRPTPSMEG